MSRVNVEICTGDSELRIEWATDWVLIRWTPPRGSAMELRLPPDTFEGLIELCLLLSKGREFRT